MRFSRQLAAFAATASLVVTLGGCAAIVPLTPAENANDPACANVTVQLPAVVGGLDKRETNAQATGAWGAPVAVQLYCGVEVPSASTTRCIEVNGVYWLVDGDDAPTYILTTYGREPAIDVVIDTETVASTGVLSDLARAVSTTSLNGHACTDLEEADRIDTSSGLSVN